MANIRVPKGAMPFFFGRLKGPNFQSDVKKAPVAPQFSSLYTSVHRVIQRSLRGRGCRITKIQEQLYGMQAQPGVVFRDLLIDKKDWGQCMPYSKRDCRGWKKRLDRTRYNQYLKDLGSNSELVNVREMRDHKHGKLNNLSGFKARTRRIELQARKRNGKAGPQKTR